MALDWCPFAVKRPVISDNFSSGRNGLQVKAVVLHIAEGLMPNVFPTFNRAGAQVSAHFCVGRDGTIEQYVAVNDTAYGNGLSWKNGNWNNSHGHVVVPTWQDIVPQINPNFYTVSIEHEGFSAETWPEAMVDANNRLLQWLGEQFALTFIPHHTLIGHYEIDPVDRPKCPGPHVDYAGIAVEVALLTAAEKLTWMPIDDQAALYKYAQANNLGYPQTDEFELVFQNENYVAQVFNLGIAYAKKGDWGNVQAIKKQ